MKYVLFCWVAFFSATPLFADCNERNHIFLIHGIGGGKSTFGVMDQYLSQVNPCNKASVFVYNTGNSSLSTYNFADDLNSFIATNFQINKLSDNDKISLITHSQGGIIGGLWLLSAKFSRPDLYRRVDSFITLSTPFWGSTMASIGKNFFFSLPWEIDNPISPFGRIELQEMNFGSSTISALQYSFSEIFLDTKVRFLAIGGLKRNFNPYFGEDDTTVPVYSSNPNHFSYEIDENGEVKISDYTKVVPFIPVKATHIKLDIPGVAKIEKKCLRNEICHHPSISHIVKHLDNQAPLADFAPELRSYRLNLYAKVLEDLVGKRSKIEVKIIKENGDSKVISLSFHHGNVLSATHSGLLNNSELQQIQVEVLLNKKTIHSLPVKVKGGISTFVNFNIKNNPSFNRLQIHK